MQNTPIANRLHIAIFGKRNVGKSSLINALTHQEIALVSNIAGTTTDPVYKTMELLPLGPIVIIDTAGLDDEGALGELRIKKTIEVLNKTELALVVIDATAGVTQYDKDILCKIKEKNIPVVGIVNKIDQYDPTEDELKDWQKDLGLKLVKVSAVAKKGIEDLKRQLIQAAPQDEGKLRIVGDLINPGDFVVLVTPIDKAAPKGRLILPQQQTIRDIIDHDAIAVVTKEHELKHTLENLGKKPAMVITDSQAFLKVAADTPKDILMTSFSILFARYKGELNQLVVGAKSIESLQSGDKVLIAEGCTHHRQADDIGKVKIPRWLRQLTGVELEFEWACGTAYPENLDEFSLIVHCGGCMLNHKEMQYRMIQAKTKQVPIVNYGVLIGYVQGVLERALEPFPLAKMLYEEE